MRDRYLYKAKRTDNGEWVEGYLFFSWERAYILWGTVNGVPDMTEADPSTICQCTGLRDRSGRQIFENDRVAFEDVTSTESGYAECDCTGRVLWDEQELCFGVTGRISAESYEALNECIVFGNMFDNPVPMEV